MRIEHVAIWARDIEKLKAFYEKYFNAKSNPIYRNDSRQFSSYFLCFDSGARLEIMHMPAVSIKDRDSDEQFEGFVHLAFSTGSEEKVRKLTERLSRDGYKVLDGPRKTGDGYYESVVLDPENNRVEITL
jgi:lactoylglutathione lyase